MSPNRADSYMAVPKEKTKRESSLYLQAGWKVCTLWASLSVADSRIMFKKYKNRRDKE